MGIVQYKVGKSWEQEVMEIYSDKGYATFKLPTEIDGTVFDIIAIKNNKCICIECKHTKTDKLYYQGSGLKHKRDDLDNFILKGNDVLIFIKSDKLGKFITTWINGKDILKEKGYLDLKNDCVRLGD